MKADVDYIEDVTSGVTSEELACAPLFRGADLSLAATLLEGAPLRILARGEALFTDAAAGPVLCVVLDGRLRINRKGAGPAKFLGTGSVFGESSLTNRAPASVHVIAAIATRVLLIAPDIFWALTYAEPVIARNLLTLVIDKTQPNGDTNAERAAHPALSRRQVKVDTLTGLPTRAGLVDLLGRQILRSAMGETPSAVLIVDIDDFEHFAVHFGSAAGDEVVCAVAQTIQRQIRPTDVAARLDGSHRFAIMLPDCDEHGARTVARRLSDDISQTVMTTEDGAILPPVTVTIGIAEQQSFDTAEKILHAASGQLISASEVIRSSVLEDAILSLSATLRSI